MFGAGHEAAKPITTELARRYCTGAAQEQFISRVFLSVAKNAESSCIIDWQVNVEAHQTATIRGCRQRCRNDQLVALVIKVDEMCTSLDTARLAVAGKCWKRRKLLSVQSELQWYTAIGGRHRGAALQAASARECSKHTNCAKTAVRRGAAAEVISTHYIQKKLYSVTWLMLVLQKRRWWTARGR